MPSSIRRIVAARVEASLLGAGTLRGWTSTRIDASLDDLEAPGPLPAPVIESLADGRDEAVHGDDGRPPQPHVTPHDPAAGSSLRLAGTTNYLVQRGETWWSLADRVLGDGRRFADLKELNMGRSQPDGTILHPAAVLRAGWTIEVPKNEATE